MDLIFDVVIRNIPDVIRSRDLLLRRLRDRAEVKGLSDLILCVVTPGQSGRAGIGLTSFEDLTMIERCSGRAWSSKGIDLNSRPTEGPELHG